MQRYTHWISTILPSLCALLLAAQAGPESSGKTLRGWLADERCASARAKSGTFTATNPDCAKKCVAEGSKIVLVDGDGERVIKIENQTSVQSNVGDYVEVTGKLDSKTNVMEVASLTFISKGSAQCIRPKARR